MLASQALSDDVMDKVMEHLISPSPSPEPSSASSEEGGYGTLKTIEPWEWIGFPADWHSAIRRHLS